MSLVSINEVAKAFNLHEVTIKNRSIKKRIPLVERKFISEELFQSWIEEKKSSVELKKLCDSFADEVAGVPATLLLYKKSCALLRGYKYGGARVYIDPVWACGGQNKFSGEIFVHKDDVDIIKGILKELYIFFLCDNEQIMTYLLDYINANSPIVNFLINPIVENKNHSILIKIELLNYLRFNLKTEFANMTDNDKHILIKGAEQDLSNNATALLIDLLNQNSGSKHGLKIFSFNKHQNESKVKLAPYDRDIYFAVAYMVFNEKHWTQNSMIEKAIESERHSKVWLYHAMQFVCAWRNEDIRTKLPRIELKDLPANVLLKVRNKLYDNEYYTNIVDQALFHFQYRSWNKKPNKIKKNSTARSLRIQIAESVKPVIGMLMVLCEAHNRLNNKRGALCETSQIEAKDGIKFFGPLYSKILSGKMFSNRMANKNYMNMLSEAADQEDIDGYMVAAYARTHTGDADHIPEVTKRYLTAKMDGYSPDEITRCLFERGVCSFVPFLLCDSLSNDSFDKLGMKEQTKKIQELNATPYEIETIIKLDYALEKKCKKHIQDILNWTKSDSIEDAARIVLDNIISGNASGKEEGIDCLKVACGDTCENPQRGTCIGCGNELYSKALFIMLSAEIFNHEKMLKQAVTEAEKLKHSAILNRKLYPAAYEFLKAMKHLYNIDITEYKRILERSGIYGIIGID